MSTAHKLTPEQLHIIQHSLGCDDYGLSQHRRRDEHDGRFGFYRNHYVCSPEADLIKLCELGLMRDGGARDLCGGMHSYHVTEAGILAMDEQSPEPPKLSRSAQRYRDFLAEDGGESFGEWLLRREHNRKIERTYA